MAEVGSEGFCGIPVPPYTLGTPWCPHPSPGTPQCLFSPHMRHHIWEESLGTWGPEGDSVANRTHPLQLSPVTPVTALADVLQLREPGSPGVQEAARAGCQSLCPGHSWGHLHCVAWAGLAQPGTTPQV